MMKQSLLKVALVEYYNTEPFLNGLESKPELFDLYRAIPSQCAELYNSGEVDIALLPIASYFEMKNSKIISDYGIACNGAVRTVVLFSNEPIDQIDKIYLDDHSRTSVQLLKILVRDYWKKEVIYFRAEVGKLELESGEAVLMIGDKVFDNEHRFKYTYDLGKEWKDHTNLPFVFAVWIARNDLEPEKQEILNAHLRKGLDGIPSKLLQWNKKYGLDLDTYLTNHIQFILTKDYQKAMTFFKEKITDVNTSALR